MREYDPGPPKTNGLIRELDIKHVVMSTIKNHIKKQKKTQMLQRQLNIDFHDQGFVFCRGNGYPFVVKNLGDRMKRILDKTSIKKHATPHIFRHTHISMLTKSGVDLSNIMKRVGHEDKQTTLNIYTHVTEKMRKDTSQKVNTTFEGLLKKSFDEKM